MLSRASKKLFPSVGKYVLSALADKSQTAHLMRQVSCFEQDEYHSIRLERFLEGLLPTNAVVRSKL